MNKLKEKRKIVIVLIGIACILFLLFACFEIISMSIENNKQLLIKDTDKILQDINYIGFSNIESVTKTLALDDNIRQFCLNNSNINKEKTVTILKAVRDITKIDLCYVLNLKGIIIAATDVLGDKSMKIEGQNLSFRPYFFEALKGKDAIYPAIGTSTNVRGLYFSSPIRDEAGNIIGVVTCKMNMDKIDELLKDYPYKVLISTFDGIIFSTNTKELLYKYVFPISKNKLEIIIKSRQFLDNKILPLRLSMKNNIAILNSNKYYLSQKSIGKTGWKILALSDFKGKLLLEPAQLRFVIIIFISILVFMVVIVILLNNIFKRHESEEMNKKLFQAVQQTSSTIVITDVNGNIEYVNPKFTELTGYEVNEAIGSNARILKSGEHKDEFYKNMWNTIITGNDWKGNFRNKRKNGETYWEENIISSVKDSRGKITNFICIKEDITRRIELDEILKKYATTDEMTGVFNRRAGMILMEKQMQISKRKNECFSIFFMDINGLKSVNDSLGHSAGDDLIVMAVSSINACLRESDTICRLGGDEFLVILPSTNKEESDVILKRIENEVAKINNEEKYSFFLSLSFGQVEYCYNSGLTVDNMIQIADEKMYENKAEIKQKQGANGIFRNR